MSGLDALAAAVEDAEAAVRAVAPNVDTRVEGEAYVGRLAAAALADAMLPHLLQEQGLLRALPVRGGPNPDYRMLRADLAPGGAYMLKGRLNGAERISVMQFAVQPGHGLQPVGQRVLDAGSTDEAGGFSLDLASAFDDPAAPPGRRLILLRILERDPGADPARLYLTGAAPADLAREGTESALLAAAQSLKRSVTDYLPWTTALGGLKNRLAPPPTHLGAAVNGEPFTQYLLGGFELAEGEWLEVDAPATLPSYWSLHAYNVWFEHLQTVGVHDRNARADGGSRVRIRVGPRQPIDKKNWVDTRGRRRGALIYRVLDASPTIELRTRICTLEHQ